MVAHHIDIVEVAGSSPVSPIKETVGIPSLLHGREPTKRSFVKVRADFLQSVEEFSLEQTKFEKRKSGDTFNAKNSRQSSIAHREDGRNTVFFKSKQIGCDWEVASYKKGKYLY